MDIKLLFDDSEFIREVSNGLILPKLTPKHLKLISKIYSGGEYLYLGLKPNMMLKIRKMVKEILDIEAEYDDEYVALINIIVDTYLDENFNYDCECCDNCKWSYRCFDCKNMNNCYYCISCEDCNNCEMCENCLCLNNCKICKN